MSFSIPLHVIGVIYIVWLPLFWILYIPLYRRLRGSKSAHLPLALLVQFIPLIGLIFLLILLYFGLKRDSGSITWIPGAGTGTPPQ